MASNVIRVIIKEKNSIMGEKYISLKKNVAHEEERLFKRKKKKKTANNEENFYDFLPLAIQHMVLMR